jgi:hypothetical protein
MLPPKKKKDRAVFLDNVGNITAGQATGCDIILRMRTACWMIKATDISLHSEYVILIAFPRQKWLRERASLSHYK